MSDPTTPTGALRVVVWGENRHERLEPEVAAIYPEGMHNTIRQGIEENLGHGAEVTTVTLDDPEHGLTEEVLSRTDVLVWWGHAAHAEVSDEVVDRVHSHVLAGMGLLVLHSGHWSKIFGKLMGTSCTLRWRSERDREIVWTVDPTHPIAKGVPHPFIIPEQEMYGEFFDIPAPDELVFLSTFSGGRSSAAAARSGAATARSSSSAREIRTIPSTTTRTCGVSSPTLPSGPGPNGRSARAPCFCVTKPKTSITAMVIRGRCTIEHLCDTRGHWLAHPRRSYRRRAYGEEMDNRPDGFA